MEETNDSETLFLEREFNTFSYNNKCENDQFKCSKNKM